jgi:hypothetical protein
MRSERLAFFLVVLGIVFPLAAAPQAIRKEKAPSPAAKAAGPLIRKDLLAVSQGQIVPPRRDIFRPRASGAPESRTAAPGGPPAPKRNGPPVREAPTFALNLVYVGSIRSAGKITALVLRDGQTTPVAVGDEIISGYKVLRITPDEIEVEGPNSEHKTFSRQGDRP